MPSRANEPSPWLTMKEAADRARVEVSTLYRYRREGRLHVSGTLPGRRGGKQLIHINHLDAQIALNWPRLEGAREPEELMEPPRPAMLVPRPELRMPRPAMVLKLPLPPKEPKNKRGESC